MERPAAGSLDFLGFRGCPVPKNLQQLWESCDVDGKTGLDKSEFAQFLSKLKDQVSKELGVSPPSNAVDVEAIFADLDEDGDGVIDPSCLIIRGFRVRGESSGERGLGGKGDDGLESIHADVPGRDPFKLAQHVPLFDPEIIRNAPDPVMDWTKYEYDQASKQFVFDPKPTLVVFRIVNWTTISCYLKEKCVAPKGLTLYGDAIKAHPSGKGKREGEVDEEWEMNDISVVMENDDAIFWCTRGTILKGEGEADLRFALKACDFGEGLMVHTGFWEVYTRSPDGFPCLRDGVFAMAQRLARDESRRHKQLILCGHSLGGALNTLITFDVLSKYPQLGSRLMYCTFGAPRTGNKNFAKAFNELIKKTGATPFRVVNTADLIPKVPPTTGIFSKYSYLHVEKEYPFTRELCSNWDGFNVNHILGYEVWLEDEIAAKSMTACEGNLSVRISKFWDFDGPCHVYAIIHLLDSSKKTRKRICKTKTKKDMNELVPDIDLKAGIKSKIDGIRVELWKDENVFKKDKCLARWQSSIYMVRLNRFQGTHMPNFGKAKMEIQCEFEATSNPKKEFSGSTTSDTD